MAAWEAARSRSLRWSEPDQVLRVGRQVTLVVEALSAQHNGWAPPVTFHVASTGEGPRLVEIRTSWPSPCGGRLLPRMFELSR